MPNLFKVLYHSDHLMKPLTILLNVIGYYFFLKFHMKVILLVSVVQAEIC